MYPLLMGNFDISEEILPLISTPSSDSSLVSSVPFHTMYMDDPWTLHSLRTLNEYAIPTMMRMSLSVAKFVYQATLEPTIDPFPFSSRKEEEDLLVFPS